jgi:hypothetical protein
MASDPDDERDAERRHDIWDEVDEPEDDPAEGDGGPGPVIAHQREPA